MLNTRPVSRTALRASSATGGNPSSQFAYLRAGGFTRLRAKPTRLLQRRPSRHWVFIEGLTVDDGLGEVLRRGGLHRLHVEALVDSEDGLDPTVAVGTSRMPVESYSPTRTDPQQPMATARGHEEGGGEARKRRDEDRTPVPDGAPSLEPIGGHGS